MPPHLAFTPAALFAAQVNMLGHITRWFVPPSSNGLYAPPWAAHKVSIPDDLCP